MARPEVTGKRVSRRVLAYQDLKERGIPWSRVHIGRLEAAGKFPQHIDLGENSIAWFEDEIDAFLEKKASERDAKVAARAAKADSSITDTQPPRTKRRAAAEARAKPQAAEA